MKQIPHKICLAVGLLCISTGILAVHYNYIKNHGYSALFNSSTLAALWISSLTTPIAILGMILFVAAYIMRSKK